MTVTPRRLHQLIFIAGVAVTLLFAGPLIGGVTGVLTLIHGSGGNTTQAAAYRIYQNVELRDFLTVDKPVMVDRTTTECEDVQRRKTNQLINSDLAQALDSLYLDVYSYRAYADRGYRDEVIIDRLSRLWTFELGALEGCIGASLLSPLCERYVRHLEATTPIDAETRARLAENARTTEQVWCLLAGDPLAEQKRRSLTTPPRPTN